MHETLNYKDLPVVQRAFELVRAVDSFVQSLPATPQGRTIGDQLFRSATSIGANCRRSWKGFGQGVRALSAYRARLS
jgi:four helix bundle protein